MTHLPSLRREHAKDRDGFTGVALHHHHRRRHAHHRRRHPHPLHGRHHRLLCWHYYCYGLRHRGSSRFAHRFPDPSLGRPLLPPHPPDSQALHHHRLRPLPPHLDPLH